jgi:hypothetical protein
MTRFAGALVVLLASAVATDALRAIPESLNAAAKDASYRNPALRKLEKERKAAFETHMASLARPATEDIKRQLADNYNNANDGQNANGADYQWDQYMNEADIGFDITNYAIKYRQCATVQTYSDILAEDQWTDTVRFRYGQT